MAKAQESPFRCIGIFGRLFGHKFNDLVFGGDTYNRTDFCTRCGMPEGGWK